MQLKCCVDQLTGCRLTILIAWYRQFRGLCQTPTRAYSSNRKRTERGAKIFKRVSAIKHQEQLKSHRLLAACKCLYPRFYGAWLWRCSMFGAREKNGNSEFGAQLNGIEALWCWMCRRQHAMEDDFCAQRQQVEIVVEEGMRDGYSNWKDDLSVECMQLVKSITFMFIGRLHIVYE